MPAVHHIGSRCFAHTMAYPSTDFPVMEKGTTQEIEWPYRRGTSLVVRVPFTTRAFVLGRWTDQHNEDDALLHAIGARWMEDSDVR